MCQGFFDKANITCFWQKRIKRFLLPHVTTFAKETNEQQTNLMTQVSLGSQTENILEFYVVHEQYKKKHSISENLLHSYVIYSISERESTHLLHTK